MEIIIDKIAIWKSDFHKEKYTVREMPLGIKYRNELGIASVSDKVIYRYAKNYKVGKTDYLLFVRTFSNDKDAVENQCGGCACHCLRRCRLPGGLHHPLQDPSQGGCGSGGLDLPFWRGQNQRPEAGVARPRHSHAYLIFERIYQPC